MVSGSLLVLVPDRLSDLVSKGEITERYYNPGDLFPDVHLALVNDDRPDVATIQPMVGSARLTVHNLPTPRRFFLCTAGWRRPLIVSWLDGAVSLASRVGASLVRCHGADVNLLAAAAIRERLGIPYVVSLHTCLEQPLTGRVERLRRRLMTRAMVDALRDADATVAVYRSILPYLDRIETRRPHLAYNVVAPTELRSKSKYSFSRPFRLVSVGRQIPGKDPRQLIAAVATRDDMTLTLIGDGPLHDDLRARAVRFGAADRISFEKSCSNAVLCRRLAEFDAFATQTSYWEMPKTILEAMLVGLPVVVNRPAPGAVPELDESICLLVEDTLNGWSDGLSRIVADDALRERLGRAARARAEREWAPEITEARYVDIYRRVLAGARHSSGE